MVVAVVVHRGRRGGGGVETIVLVVHDGVGVFEGGHGLQRIGEWVARREHDCAEGVDGGGQVWGMQVLRGVVVGLQVECGFSVLLRWVLKVWRHVVLERRDAV